MNMMIFLIMGNCRVIKGFNKVLIMLRKGVGFVVV